MNQTDKIEIVKRSVPFVTFLSVNHILKNVYPMNVPPRSRFESIMNFYGRVVVTSIVTEVASNHVKSRIDQLVEWYDTNVVTKDQ